MTPGGYIRGLLRKSLRLPSEATAYLQIVPEPENVNANGHHMTLPPPPPAQPSEPTSSQPLRMPPLPPGLPSQAQVTRQTPPPPAAWNPYGGPPPGRKRAGLALAYGLVGLIPVVGAIPALFAVLMGLSSQKASRAADLNPYGTSKAGVILGLVGIAITVLLVIVLAVGAGVTAGS